MLVGVDGFPVSGPRTGVGRYVGELSKALASHAQVKIAMDRTGSDPDVSDLAAKGIDIHYAPWVLDRLFWVSGRLGRWLPYDLKIGRVDAMVFTRYFRFRMSQDVPDLSMVYDFSFLHAPETINDGPEWLLANVPPMIEASDHVGVISQTMAQQCAVAFPDARDKIVVLEPGLSTDLVEADATGSLVRLRQLGLRPGYLLFVGSVEPRKNLMPLIEAVKRLPPDVADDRPLVIAGGPGWRNEEILSAIESARDRVRRLPPFVDDGTLKALYVHAAALVFPSRYEGFGLPLLEAMHLGTPVLCSDIPVFREVAQDAALYFDHEDPDDIAGTIESFLLAGEELREGLISEGHARAASYSWDRSARRLVRMLAGVGETSGWEPVATPSQPPTGNSRGSRSGQVRIAVLSTPRTGNTWLRHLLADVLQAGWLAVHEPHEVPWDDLPRRSILQLHWYPDDRLTALLERHGFLTCTVARHPCDVLVSILRYAQAAEETHRWLRGEGGDERGLLGATPASPAFEDYVSSTRARKLLGVTPAWAEIPSTRLVRYEDLLDDTLGTLTETFADVPFDRSRLAGSVERTSLRRMRRMHRDRAFHFWQGQAGTWKSLVPTDIAEMIATTHAGAMDVGGYSVRRPERLDTRTAERNWYALEAESLRDETRFLREQIARVGERLEEVEGELSESRPILASQEVRFVVEENLGMRSLRVARVLKRVRDILGRNG